jgi:hypothetical protein
MYTVIKIKYHRIHPVELTDGLSISTIKINNYKMSIFGWKVAGSTPDEVN